MTKMSSTQIQRDMAELQTQILDEGYYVGYYARALRKHGMTVDSIRESEVGDKQIVNMANTFWFNLPDGPEIRTPEFFALCKIAEHCFD